MTRRRHPFTHQSGGHPSLLPPRLRPYPDAPPSHCGAACLHPASQVLGKKDVEIGVADKLGVEQFIAAWKLLGLTVEHAMVFGIFNKFGQDMRGQMPCVVGEGVACIPLFPPPPPRPRTPLSPNPSVP